MVTHHWWVVELNKVLICDSWTPRWHSKATRLQPNEGQNPVHSYWSSFLPLIAHTSLFNCSCANETKLQKKVQKKTLIGLFALVLVHRTNQHDIKIMSHHVDPVRIRLCYSHSCCISLTLKVYFPYSLTSRKVWFYTHQDSIFGHLDVVIPLYFRTLCLRALELTPKPAPTPTPCQACSSKVRTLANLYFTYLCGEGERLSYVYSVVNLVAQE